MQRVVITTVNLSSEILLKQNALKIRMGIIQAISANHGGHIGGSLDLAELLSVLYTDFIRIKPEEPNWSDRDYMIFSKGHAGPALYSSLAFRGVFTYDYLNNLNNPNSKLPGHCDRDNIPGVDATTGSLGQGLSIACGVAMAAKIRKTDQKVYCVIGDGEAAEGQIWEAAESAAHFKLDNLIAFLDNNNMQIDGSNDEVLSLGDPVKKFEAFGWDVVCVDGEDVIEIQSEINKALKSDNKKPHMIVLKTIKGRGAKCVEEMKNNHCIGFPDELKNKVMDDLRNTAIELGMEDYFNDQQIYWK